jgi:hypothetical protein
MNTERMAFALLTAAAALTVLHAVVKESRPQASSAGGNGPQQQKPATGSTQVSPRDLATMGVPLPPSSFFHNERLKATVLSDRSITGDKSIRIVDGLWFPESKDPGKALLFPEQVKIVCTHAGKVCRELSVVLAAAPGMVSIQEINETEYEVASWDARGLVAWHDPGLTGCQRQVLTMDFDSGAVSVSDVPTHRKECAAFTETNTYRLARGTYYVDTSPGNDQDKPYQKK